MTGGLIHVDDTMATPNIMNDEIDQSTHNHNTRSKGADALESSASNSVPFCLPSDSMVMYMDGFRFSLQSNDQPCLNLYFPTWTLDTRGKFAGAMLGIFALAVLTEGISKFRFLASRRLQGSAKRWSVTGLHGLQALVGYILMLATMTFSVELLGCVIMGLGSGFAVFYDDHDTHVTTNPCCNFIQDEANERIDKTTFLQEDSEEGSIGCPPSEQELVDDDPEQSMTV